MLLAPVFDDFLEPSLLRSVGFVTDALFVPLYIVVFINELLLFIAEDVLPCCNYYCCYLVLFPLPCAAVESLKELAELLKPDAFVKF